MFFYDVRATTYARCISPVLFLFEFEGLARAGCMLTLARLCWTSLVWFDLVWFEAQHRTKCINSQPKRSDDCESRFGTIHIAHTWSLVFSFCSYLKMMFLDQFFLISLVCLFDFLLTLLRTRVQSPVPVLMSHEDKNRRTW